jgi:hypothetical protein
MQAFAECLMHSGVRYLTFFGMDGGVFYAEKKLKIIPASCAFVPANIAYMGHGILRAISFNAIDSHLPNKIKDLTKIATCSVLWVGSLAFYLKVSHQYPARVTAVGLTVCALVTTVFHHLFDKAGPIVKPVTNSVKNNLKLILIDLVSGGLGAYVALQMKLVTKQQAIALATAYGVYEIFNYFYEYLLEEKPSEIEGLLKAQEYKRATLNSSLYLFVASLGLTTPLFLASLTFRKVSSLKLLQKWA